ncbi:PAS domain-containing sensor histidine kinase [Frigidibacter oleivorans]|uniref:PAS domain-containing sensor histidine kinase n=1 Tax=Frigidibacter oleivorans TaxID=2487129 RepID=UPI000F8DE255|nr:PAS domain-containing protein [Frigidibacter oleivorans]
MFSANTECARLMREFDWAANPLGPAESWPPELRTLVSVMHGSGQPMFLTWGPEQIMLYNDGYAEMCEARHPAIGKTFRELWYDIWDDVSPILFRAYAGQGTQMDDISFIMHRNGYPEETHFAFSYTPVKSERGEVLGMFCCCTETTAQVMARRREEQEREILYTCFRLSPGAVALLRGPKHEFRMVNRAYSELIGFRDVIGKPVAEALPEVVEQGYVDLLDRVYETGEPHVGEGVTITLQRDRDRPPQQRVLDFVFQPFPDDTGATAGVLVQAVDVTDRHEAERRQQIVNAELSHRMKNQLAVVRALVSQTLRTVDNTKAALSAVGERLMALSRAQDLLLGVGSGDGEVGALVAVALEPWQAEPGRMSFGGPPVPIAPQAMPALALILYELATNAVKHGALAAPDGHVALDWTIDRTGGEPVFTLCWRESGNRDVLRRPPDPRHRGAGLRLIAASAGSLGGTHEQEIGEEGAQFLLRVPLSALSRSAGAPRPLASAAG